MAQKQAEDDEVLTPEQTADLMKITRRHLMKELVAKHKIPFIQRPGSNQIRFFRSDVLEVLRSWRVGYVTAAGKPPREKKVRRKVKAKARGKR